MSLQRKLSNVDYARGARQLHPKVEPEALMAVGMTESRGEGFYQDGFPVILFERHKFYKNADRSKRNDWARSMPSICHPKRTPKGMYGTTAEVRHKFNVAFRLDPEATMMACSWGAFQELGENYDDYGFHTVGEFVDMMKSGIAGQLEIFTRSIRHRGLIDELLRHDWAGFARNYNGPAYRDFKYDDKMAEAYKTFKARKIDWEQLLAEAFAKEINDATEGEFLSLAEGIGPDSTDKTAAVENFPPQRPSPSVEEPVAEEQTGQAGSSSASAADQPSADPPPPSAPAGDAPSEQPKFFLNVEDWKPFVRRWIARIWGYGVPANLTQGFGFLTAAVKDPDNWMIYAIVGGTLFVVIAAVGLILTAILVGILFWNRKEIVHYITESWRAKMDPNVKNFGLSFEKK